MEEIDYYGYEEVGAGDDACDVTIQSTYNAPDLTNASLYIDGLKGSAATDHSGLSVAVAENNATWDSTEKAWVLSARRTQTSSVRNLASLVGDHPHSVSAWVKADQLNGDGLFHVGTTDGAGDAASRVGFVDDSHISWGGEDHYFSNAEWHNVTYTYNGEGSDKKLYLDGRLVDTAKNEDTFGDYPPFAMSGYSEYGYAVSASDTHDGGNVVWKAFDNNTSTFWFSFSLVAVTRIVLTTIFPGVMLDRPLQTLMEQITLEVGAKSNSHTSLYLITYRSMVGHRRVLIIHTIQIIIYTSK